MKIHTQQFPWHTRTRLLCLFVALFQSLSGWAQIVELPRRPAFPVPTAKPKPSAKPKPQATPTDKAKEAATPSAQASEPKAILPPQPSPTVTPQPTMPPAEKASPPVNMPSVNVPVGQVDKAGYTLRPVELNVSQWPALRLDYSIERADHTPFTRLTASDIQIQLDGKAISLTSDALKLKGNASAGILLVIDLSRSMTHDQEGISKLAATKEALLALVNSMDAQERIGIVAFDASPRVALAPTNNRQALQTIIQSLAFSPDAPRATGLYAAADFALQYAQTNQLHNVILLSDGCEYTPESRQHRQAGTYNQFKAAREQAIAEASRRSGTRLFTVAIGEQDLSSPLYVDVRSLENLTQGTLGGFSSFVDLPALVREANGDRQQYAALLIGNLKTVLDHIKQSFQFDYSLLLHNATLPAPDNQPHKVVVSFRVGNTQLPLEFSYTWKTGAAQPDIGQWTVLAPVPVLIEAPTIQTKRPYLIGIFAAFLLLLGVLALIPITVKAIERWKERRRLCDAIVTISSNSTHILAGNKTCLNEGNEPSGSGHFKSGDVVVICPNCQKVHHLSCWHLSKDHCWNRLCRYELKIPRELFG